MKHKYIIKFNEKKVFKGSKAKIIKKLQKYAKDIQILSNIKVIYKDKTIEIDSKTNPLGFNFITDLNWSKNKGTIAQYMYSLQKTKFNEDEKDIYEIAKELYKQCEEVMEK